MTQNTPLTIAACKQYASHVGPSSANSGACMTIGVTPLGVEKSRYGT